MANLPRIIGITGYAQHGKDTVAGVLMRELGYSRIAFSDKLKEALLVLDPIVRPLVTAGPGGQGYQGYGKRLSEEIRQVGPERAKECAEYRRLLQVMGTEVGRNLLGEDVWVAALGREPGVYGERKVVIPDLRFQNEADWVHRMHGEVWRVLRTAPGGGDFDNGVGKSHPSERDVASIRTDQSFHNGSSKAQLQDTVFRYLKNRMAIVGGRDWANQDAETMGETRPSGELRAG